MSHDPFDPPWWYIVRHGTFRFYWFPGVRLGIYKRYHNGGMLAINLGLCTFEWTDA